MVVSGGYPGYEAGGPAGGGGEPFLQRWLFSRRLVYLLAALAVVAALAGGGWWLTSGRYTKVPAVAALSAASAEQALHQAGFQVRTGTSVTDDNVPKGDVVSVSPSGRALPGTTVTLTLSQGPRMITVPQIPTTDTVAQAEATLRAAGLTVAATTDKVGVASNPVIGTVAGTDPPAGTSVAENKPVTVQEVAGLALPNLVGQNINDAQAWAAQNQVTLAPTQVDNSQPQGTIVDQNPAQSTPVTPGQTISVSVSNGPPQVPIPGVQGMDCQQAQQQLQQAGFQVSVQQGWFHKNQAASTSPSGQAPSGSAVTLVCGSNNPFG
jgi:serine/threonine-protein kinase